MILMPDLNKISILKSNWLMNVYKTKKSLVNFSDKFNHIIEEIRFFDIGSLDKFVKNAENNGNKIGPWFRLINDNFLYEWWKSLDRVTEAKNLEINKSDFYNLKKTLILPALSCVLILLEPDFGTTLIISGIILFQLLFSGVKLRYPIGIIAISPLPIYFAINLMGYRESRFVTWFSKICEGTNVDPVDLAGRCYQLHQSKVAISSGGLFGLGPGTSRARWGSLPNSWSDFIASIAGEEYGFFGLLILIIALILLIISYLTM